MTRLLGNGCSMERLFDGKEETLFLPWVDRFSKFPVAVTNGVKYVYRPHNESLLEISVADMLNKPIEHIPRFSIYVNVCFETTLSMELRFLSYELIIQPNIGVQPIKMQFKYTSWVNKEASLIDVMMPFFANGFNEKRERSLCSKTESVEGLILLEYVHDIRTGNVLGKVWAENGSFGGYKSMMFFIDKVSWDYDEFICRCLKDNCNWDYEGNGRRKSL